MAINGNNFYNCIRDVAAGKLGDTDWIVFSDGQYGVYATSDQGLTWKILQTTPELLAINYINNSTPVRITEWEYGSTPSDGEKVTIEGSRIAELNGTFHTLYNGGYIELYHDVGLTDPVASLGAHQLWVDVSVTGNYGDHTVIIDDVSNLAVGMISEGYNPLTSWESDNTGNNYTANVNKIVSIDGNNVTMKFPWHGANGHTYTIGFQAVMYRSYGDGITALAYGDGAFIGMSWNNLERAYKTTDLNTWQSTTLGSGAQNSWFQTINQINSVAYGTVTTHGAMLRSDSNTVPGYTNYLSLSDTFQLNVVAGDPQWTYDKLSSSTGFGQGTIQIDPTVGSWAMAVSMSGVEGYTGIQETGISTYNTGNIYQDGNHIHDSVLIHSEGYTWSFDNDDGYFFSQRLTVGDNAGSDNDLYGDSVIHGIYFYTDDSHSQNSTERGIYVNNGQLLIDAAYGTGGDGAVQIGWNDDENYTRVDYFGTTINTEGYHWNFSDDCNDDNYGVLYNPESTAIQIPGYWKIGDYFNDWTGTYIKATNYSDSDPGDVEIYAQGDIYSAAYYFDRYGVLTFDYGDGVIQSTGYWAVGDYQGNDSYTFIGATDYVDGNPYDIEIAADDTYFYFTREGKLVLPPGGDIVNNNDISVLGKEMAQTKVTSGDYTLVYNDRGGHIYNTGTGKIKIPTNAGVAFPIGTVITIISADNSFTVVPVYSGTTVIIVSNSGPSTSVPILANTYSTMLKIDTDKWIIERAS
jgi:hypothetical protein